MQAVHLVSNYTKKNVHSNEALMDLLYMLEAFLPDEHHMPPTHYHHRKFLRKPLSKGLDQTELVTAQLCRNPKCDHLYDTYPGGIDDTCPRADCKTARFKCGPHSLLLQLPLGIQPLLAQCSVFAGVRSAASCLEPGRSDTAGLQTA